MSIIELLMSWENNSVIANEILENKLLSIADTQSKINYVKNISWSRLNIDNGLHTYWANLRNGNYATYADLLHWKTLNIDSINKYMMKDRIVRYKHMGFHMHIKYNIDGIYYDKIIFSFVTSNSELYLYGQKFKNIKISTEIDNNMIKFMNKIIVMDSETFCRYFEISNDINNIPKSIIEMRFDDVGKIVLDNFLWALNNSTWLEISSEKCKEIDKINEILIQVENNIAEPDYLKKSLRQLKKYKDYKI